MTSPAEQPLPRLLQPTAKSVPVTSSSDFAVSANEAPALPSGHLQPFNRQRRGGAENVDATAEKATLALIRRVLTPDANQTSDTPLSSTSLEGWLPPLTSSNDVDFQLYAIIAIVIKDFVNSWYQNITSDHTFIDEVLQIIAHCTRALEQRVRGVNVQELVLDEVPMVLLRHLNAFRTAHSRSLKPDYCLELHQVYHALNPHPALTTTPRLDTNNMAKTTLEDNETVYRHLLVQSVLAVVLPTEDLENFSLRTLVTDIIADLILGQVIAEKMSERWFLEDTITRIVVIVKAHIEPKATGEELEVGARSRLEKFGLLSVKAVANSRHSPKPHQSGLMSYFWRIMQYGYLAILFLRFTVVGILQARRLPSRVAARKGADPSSPSALSVLVPIMPQETGPVGDRPPRAVLTYRILAFLSTFLDLSTRMPWLASSLAFGQHLLTAAAGRLVSANSVLDRFLYQTIDTHILPPSLLPLLLLNSRRTLFPNNSLGPPNPPPPTASECLAIRRQCASDILSLVPSPVKSAFFASAHEAEWISQTEEMLEAFGDARLNKYWIYGVLELCLVRLVPEIGAKSWSELMRERGIDVDSEGETDGLGKD